MNGVVPMLTLDELHTWARSIGGRQGSGYHAIFHRAVTDTAYYFDGVLAYEDGSALAGQGPDWHTVPALALPADVWDEVVQWSEPLDLPDIANARVLIFTDTEQLEVPLDLPEW